MDKRRFFRVCNPDSQQGLWYDFKGNFTGLIHNKFDFCSNSNLDMDYDPELVGWLSATDNLSDLFKWFTVADILRLQEHGWFIYEYEVTTTKFYHRFAHPVIEQASSKLVRRHEIFSREILIQKFADIWSNPHQPDYAQTFGEEAVESLEFIVKDVGHPVEVYYDWQGWYWSYPGYNDEGPQDEYLLTVFPDGE